jgi:proteasome lid subunit RPN8/RPN11
MDDGFSQSKLDLSEFILTESQKKILIEHTYKGFPNESCAILFGKLEDEKYVVNDLFLTKNIEASPEKFTISNDQLIKAYAKAEQLHQEVLAIFHSHPFSEAYPSSTDKKFMDLNPVVWLIFSVVARDFRAFVLRPDLLEIPITDLS